jgi:putative peptidoglycan lipid II flippase
MPLFVFLIAPGFDGHSEKMELTIYLTRITFPFLFFVSLSSFFGAILNSHNRFAIAAASPIILNILLLTVLFFGVYILSNIKADALLLSKCFLYSNYISLILLTLFIIVNYFYERKKTITTM